MKNLQKKHTLLMADIDAHRVFFIFVISLFMEFSVVSNIGATQNWLWEIVFLSRINSCRK